MAKQASKISISASLGAISAYLGTVVVPIIILLILMIIDYIMGLTNAWIADNISSKKSIIGIIKKVGYIAVIAVAIACDFTINYALSFTGEEFEISYVIVLIVIVWLIINECISILENLANIGIPIPRFLIAIVNHLKIVTEKKGENTADTQTTENDDENKSDGQEGDSE